MLTSMRSCLRLFLTRDMLMLSSTMLFTGLVRSLCFGVYSAVIGYTKGCEAIIGIFTYLQPTKIFRQKTETVISV